MHNLLKARHQELTRKITSATGRGTKKHQLLKKHLNWVGRNAKETMEKKYDKKVAHLQRKHQTDARKLRRDQIVTKWRGHLKTTLLQVDSHECA